MADRLARVLFWSVLVFVSYNAVAPPDRVTAPSVSDVVLHAGAFGTLTVLLLAGYERLGLWRAMGLLLLYGGAIEVAQSWLPERSAEWKDFAVDALGISLAATGYELVGRRCMDWVRGYWP